MSTFDIVEAYLGEGYIQHYDGVEAFEFGTWVRKRLKKGDIAINFGICTGDISIYWYKSDDGIFYHRFSRKMLDEFDAVYVNSGWKIVLSFSDPDSIRRFKMIINTVFKEDNEQ